VYAMYGYDIGMAPPQRCSPSFVANCSRGNSSTEPYLAAHHMLLAHASAARLYRKKYKVKFFVEHAPLYLQFIFLLSF